MISQRVGSGTRLNPAAASILAEPLQFLILLDGITFDELMEARLIVEPELAARAQSRMHDAVHRGISVTGSTGTVYVDAGETEPHDPLPSTHSRDDSPAGRECGASACAST